MIRLGVLGSTKGTDLGAIIQAIDKEEYEMAARIRDKINEIDT